MKILISAVGDTDPIRGNHDGPLLHISRYYRPDKIVLIFSEGMLRKEERLKTAILSIHDDYHPEIEVEPKLLLDNDVFRFDEMFEQLSEIIGKYTNTWDEFLLNLSSGTPQIISAIFTINKINDFNIKAIQVPTPLRGSNRNNPDDQKEITELIADNEDRFEKSEKRIIEESAEKFSQSLIKRNLKELIRSYDYQGVYELLVQPENSRLVSRSKRGRILAQTETIVSALKYQKLLPDLVITDDFSDQAKKALNYFLLIDLINKRGFITDVLIKSKSLAEFVFQDYIETTYPHLIRNDEGKPKINLQHPLSDSVNDYIGESFRQGLGENYDENRAYDVQSVLNMLSFKDILDFLEPENRLTKLINPILSLNNMRNKVAHGLSEMDINLVNNKKIKELIQALRELLTIAYGIEEESFAYFEEKNMQLLHLLS